MTDRPFVERLTQFWTNHFAVSVDKNLVLGLAGSLEREAIRPNVLGHFRICCSLSSATRRCCCTSTTICLSGRTPRRPLARRRQAERKIGINENLARETLELHTLGVGGGYTQADVTTFAEVITGWSIGGDGRSRFSGRARRIHVSCGAPRARGESGAR